MNWSISRVTAIRWSVVIIFLLSCLVAVMFLDLKAQALKYHNRDYPFYLQFAAKLFDPQLPRRFTINPDGFNYLGFAGTEGAAGFHQSVHLEPIRYFAAAAFAVTRKPVSLFAFYAILYFLPLLYFAYLFPLKSSSDRWFFLLFIFLYVLFPLSLSALADDLRPRTLMVPAFLLCFMAMYWQRNWFEKLVFFGLLLFTREEALILAAGLIPYDILRARSCGRKNPVAFLFIGLGLAWAWIQYRYFLWTGYSISNDLTLTQTIKGFLGQWPWAVAALIGLAVLIFLFRSRLKRIWGHADALPIGTFVLLILPPLLVQCVREEAHWFQSSGFLTGSISAARDLLFLPKNVLLFAGGLLLLLQVWDSVRQAKARRWILSIAGGVLLISAAAGITAAVKEAQGFQTVIPYARVLVDLRAKTDRLSSPILTDYATNQAFYDYDQQYVFERLPYDVLPGQARFYPASLTVLKDLVRSRVAYVAISAENKEKVLQLLRTVRVKPQILAENQMYVVMRLR